MTIVYNFWTSSENCSAFPFRESDDEDRHIKRSWQHGSIVERDSVLIDTNGLKFIQIVLCLQRDE